MTHRHSCGQGDHEIVNDRDDHDERAHDYDHGVVHHHADAGVIDGHPPQLHVHDDDIHDRQLEQLSPPGDRHDAGDDGRALRDPSPSVRHAQQHASVTPIAAMAGKGEKREEGARREAGQGLPEVCPSLTMRMRMQSLSSTTMMKIRTRMMERCSHRPGQPRVGLAIYRQRSARLSPAVL
jgi:hypothetical protein